MNEKKQAESFDSLLIKYQKWSLVFIYPAVLSLVSLFVGIFATNFSYSLCFGSISTLALYLKANPLGGNVASSNVFLVVVGLLVTAIFVFLSLRAAKAKFYAPIVASVLYLADTIYTSLLVIPNIAGQLEIASYVTMLLIHIAFLTLFSFVFVSYAKLYRFQKEVRSQK
jgi:hypothetical protein